MKTPHSDPRPVPVCRVHNEAMEFVCYSGADQHFKCPVQRCCMCASRPDKIEAPEETPERAGPAPGPGAGFVPQMTCTALARTVQGLSIAAMTPDPSNPQGEPCQRASRAECRVGDWVMAVDVPEWTFDRSAHPFQPSGRIFPVLAGPTPHPVPAPTTWLFRGGFRTDGAANLHRIWRRES